MNCEEGRLAIVWEAPENIRKTKARLEYVLSGCKCKTGCATLRCGWADSVDQDAAASTVLMAQEHTLPLRE